MMMMMIMIFFFLVSVRIWLIKEYDSPFDHKKLVYI